MFKLRLAIKWPFYATPLTALLLTAFLIRVLWVNAFDVTSVYIFGTFVLTLGAQALIIHKFHRTSPVRQLIPAAGSLVVSWYLPKLPDVQEIIIENDEVWVRVTPGWDFDPTDMPASSAYLAATLGGAVAEEVCYGAASFTCGPMLDKAENIEDVLRKRHDKAEDILLNEAVVRARQIVRDHKAQIEQIATELTRKTRLGQEELTAILGPRPTIWEARY